MYQDEEVEEIQNDYKRRQILIHSLGPSVAVIVHVVFFLALLFLVVAKTEDPKKEIDIITFDLEPKKIDPIDPPIDTPTLTPPLSITSPSDHPTTPTDEPDEPNTEDQPEVDTNEPLDMTDILIFKTPTASQFDGSRTNKTAIVKAQTGSSEAISRVQTSLKWLKKNQNPDGSWGERHKAAMTALATLLFLAHGEKPSSANFGRNVEKSLRWLVKAIEQNNMGRRGYAYSIMVYAVSEAYSLTGIPNLEPAMNKGVATLLDGYQKNGGFDYDYKHTGKYDLSFSGWSFQALKAAKIAEAKHPRLNKVIKEIPKKLIQNMAYKSPKGEKNDAFYYKAKHQGHNGGPNYYTRSAGVRSIGTLTLQLLGDKAEAQAAARLIGKQDIRHLKWGNSLKWPFYTWYYSTQVLYMNKDRQPLAWQKWSKRFQSLLYENQFKDGHWERFGKDHKN